MTLIYTIGHSNRTMQEFTALLRKYNIEQIIDVRRFPTSKKYPWFTKQNLEEELANIGIRYIWLGDLLGGYRREGYQIYTTTENYKRGIEHIIIISNKYRTAILCSEKLWFRCHRRFISDTLLDRGIQVIHIVDYKKIYKHKKKKI